MRLYGIYEDNEEETCRFVGTAKECAKEMGVYTTTIYHVVCLNHRLRRKYYVRMIAKEGEW